MNRQNRVGLAQLRALVDDLLRAALYFRVAALHRVKVQTGRVGARRHGTGRAAAHANAHARAAELDQQCASRKQDFSGQPGVNRAQAAGDHDGLVVTPALAAGGLFKLPKIARQVGPAKFVVEGGASQRAIRHDLQRAGNMLGLAIVLAFGGKQSGHGEPRQTRLGFGAAPGRTFVPDLAARTGGRTSKWGNGGRVVVRLDLHQHMGQHGIRGAILLIAVQADSTWTRSRFSYFFSHKALNKPTFHDRRVV